jgi:hypothetical protein
MDAVAALLAEARAAGLSLKVDGDRLIVRGPKAAEPIVRRLRDAKPAILERLRTAPTPDALPPLTRSDAFAENEFIARAHGGISGKTRQDVSAARMRQPAGHVVDLDAVTLCEHFDVPLPQVTALAAGRVLDAALRTGQVDSHAVACLRFDVLAAVRELAAGIAAGVLPPRRLVAGRPLADWLSLDDVAALFRAWGERR